MLRDHPEFVKIQTCSADILPAIVLEIAGKMPAIVLEIAGKMPAIVLEIAGKMPALQNRDAPNVN